MLALRTVVGSSSCSSNLFGVLKLSRSSGDIGTGDLGDRLPPLGVYPREDVRPRSSEDCSRELPFRVRLLSRVLLCPSLLPLRERSLAASMLLM